MMSSFIEFINEKRSDDIHKANNQMVSFFEHLGAVYSCKHISNWDMSISNSFNNTVKLISSYFDVKSFILDYLRNNFDQIVLDVISKTEDYKQIKKLRDIDFDEFYNFTEKLLNQNPTRRNVVSDFIRDNIDDLQCDMN